MTVENHPLFKAWVEALHDLKSAQDIYQAAVAFERKPDWVEHTRLMKVRAQENFNRVSDRIGANA